MPLSPHASAAARSSVASANLGAFVMPASPSAKSPPLVPREQPPPTRRHARYTGSMKKLDRKFRLGKRFDDALRYALRVHRKQARKGKPVPYAAHLLGVAGTVLAF